MPYLVFFYGTFILIGGITAYAKASSLTSFIMGLTFGILLWVAAGAMKAGQRWGGYFALILTLVLESTFSWRWVSTGKFIPPGLLALVSFFVLIVLAANLQLLTNKKKFK